MLQREVPDGAARAKCPAVTIKTEAELRALLGEPTALVQAKVAARLNELTRQFIERSPFVCLSTSNADGHCDVSPRVDPAGFVRILDEVTLLLPERPGNRLADSLSNILSNPRVGLLFLIPGVGDSFRVNGRASLITDQALLAPSAMEGKVPKLCILVNIEEAYTQCSKALIRSELWNPRASSIARREDEVVLRPEQTRSRSKKLTRERAWDVVRRSEAWGSLVAHVFPRAIRLSIHPQPDPSTKIGVNLLGVRDPWLTPWHAAAVIDRFGTTLMHRADAEALGAKLALDGTRPSHLELA